MSLPAIGFPAQPRHDLMSRLISQIRGRADTARQEAVTGLLADPAAALGGKVSELLGLEQSLAEIAQYREIIGLAESRAGVIQGTLDVLRNLAVDLPVRGQAALDSNLGAVGETVSAAARQALGAAISALNVSFGGRRLFAGDAGNAQAVTALEVFMAASVPILEAGPTAGAAYANLSVQFSVAGGLFETTFYTGGSGDVLTGMIAALIGQSLSSYDAACVSVYIHGLAGDIAAKRFGQISLIATDLIETLPEAFCSHQGASGN